MRLSDLQGFKNSRISSSEKDILSKYTIESDRKWYDNGEPFDFPKLVKNNIVLCYVKCSLNSKEDTKLLKLYVTYNHNGKIRRFTSGHCDDNGKPYVGLMLNDEAYDCFDLGLDEKQNVDINSFKLVEQTNVETGESRLNAIML